MVDDASCERFTFKENTEMLLDTESSAGRNRKVAKYVKWAELKMPEACVKDVVRLSDCILSKDRITSYAGRRRVEDCEELVIISKTECGKSHLCQVRGNAACCKLKKVRYMRLEGICEGLDRACTAADDSYFEIMGKLKTVPLLIVHEFVTTPMTMRNAVDLLEIMKARENRC